MIPPPDYRYLVYATTLRTIYTATSFFPAPFSTCHHCVCRSTLHFFWVPVGIFYTTWDWRLYIYPATTPFATDSATTHHCTTVPATWVPLLSFTHHTPYLLLPIHCCSHHTHCYLVPTCAFCSGTLCLPTGVHLRSVCSLPPAHTITGVLLPACLFVLGLPATTFTCVPACLFSPPHHPTTYPFTASTCTHTHHHTPWQFSTTCTYLVWCLPVHYHHHLPACLPCLVTHYCTHCVQTTGLLPGLSGFTRSATTPRSCALPQTAVRISHWMDLPPPACLPGFLLPGLSLHCVLYRYLPAAWDCFGFGLIHLHFLPCLLPPPFLYRHYLPAFTFFHACLRTFGYVPAIYCTRTHRILHHTLPATTLLILVLHLCALLHLYLNTACKPVLPDTPPATCTLPSAVWFYTTLLLYFARFFFTLLFRSVLPTTGCLLSLYTPACWVLPTTGFFTTTNHACWIFQPATPRCISLPALRWFLGLPAHPFCLLPACRAILTCRRRRLPPTSLSLSFCARCTAVSIPHARCTLLPATAVLVSAPPALLYACVPVPAACRRSRLAPLLDAHATPPSRWDFAAVPRRAVLPVLLRIMGRTGSLPAAPAPAVPCHRTCACAYALLPAGSLRAAILPLRSAHGSPYFYRCCCRMVHRACVWFVLDRFCVPPCAPSACFSATQRAPPARTAATTAPPCC